ncbi:sporulation-specific protein 22 [Neofusicoccum ribis]|uniref:Sporulation-specific protein 22 n=1 Tax=Neofusicoccum ribis TaxID=45134 RepID=A0ABR3SYU1_9PEZI
MVEKEKKVTALVAFATSLSNRLHRLSSDPGPPDSTPDDRPLADLKPALTTHLVATFPLPPSSALVAKREPLDRLATEIWNHATRLGRQQEAERTVDTRTLCLVRGFAVLALDTAAGGEKDGGTEEVDKGVRIMRVALKAARCWVEAGKAEETGLMRVLECAAGWEGRLKEAGGGDVDAVEVVGRLRAEYWMLRTVHAWKQSRLDLAEHMFLKSELESSRLAPDIADMLTDTLFEIGKDLFDKRQYEDAVKWLDRAFTAIEQRNLEELDHDAVELRLATLNFLVRAYLRVGDPDSKQKARKIVNLLELEHDHKIVVQLLKLDVLSADLELDIEQYYAVVVRMIGLMVFTDSAFKTIMHHVHKIKSKNTELAGKALDKLLHTRLLTNANKQWIEKVVVTQVWIYVDSGDDQPSNLLRDLLDVVLHDSHTFEAPATHAAQTILWKRTEIAYSQGKYMEAESWCNIALHPLFQKAGDLNKAKIARKIILCSVARHEHNTARKVFFEMSDSAKNAPMTRYLMYKSAIRDQQPDFAAECLDVICRQSSKDATLLYACVMEAQQSVDKHQAILALQKVLEKYDYGTPVGVHLPALLRSTIRLLVPHLGSAENINENAMEELCKVFEGAVVQATKAARRLHDQEMTDPIFTEPELEWFSRNSYNISLKYCGSTHPSHLLSDAATSGSAMSLGAATRADLAAKRAQLLRYELESALKRNDWDGLDALWDECFDVQDTNSTHTGDIGGKAKDKGGNWYIHHLETLADLALVIHAELTKADTTNLENGSSTSTHRARILGVLQRIVNQSWQAGGEKGADVVHLARWIRCLFQLSLDGGAGAAAVDQDAIPLQCVEQASDVITSVGIASVISSSTSSGRRASSGDAAPVGANAYPQNEADWLASTAFNRGVDFFCAGDDARCQRWVERALQLAKAAERGGGVRGLHGVLQEKYKGLLRWEED